MANDRPGKPPFIHERGLCESVKIGADTRIWAFAHVLPGARLGANCNICDHVYIENDVVVGDDVTVKCGVQLWDGLRIGNRVFIGPNATFTNDMRPRSKVYPDAFLQTHLEDDVSIGANATILPGLRIGRGAMVGAGAVVTRDIPPYAVVVGNPAAIVSYAAVDTPSAEPRRTDVIAAGELGAEAGSRLPLGVRGCFLERLPQASDAMGELVRLENARGLPFQLNSISLLHGPGSWISDANMPFASAGSSSLQREEPCPLCSTTENIRPKCASNCRPSACISLP